MGWSSIGMVAPDISGTRGAMCGDVGVVRRLR